MPGLINKLVGTNANWQPVQLPAASEKVVTIIINDQEIVTVMTFGDYLEELTIGFLFNQNIISAGIKIEQVD